jgi:hypothetical protein
MPDRISFMGANYVARFVNYHMTAGWSEGNDATEAHYRPVASFAERFGELVRGIRALGFQTLDIWTAQLNWAWATPEHVEIARQVLAEEHMQVASLAGGFGSTSEDLTAALLTVPRLLLFSRNTAYAWVWKITRRKMRLRCLLTWMRLAMV